MTKSELTAIAAERAGISKREAEQLVSALIDTISQTLEQGEAVLLTGFGTFEVRQRQAKVGRDPRTKEPMTIPATQVPVFRPCKCLKDRVAK